MPRTRNIMMDKVLKGVGRIHRSLETAEPKEAERRLRLILMLHDHKRLDILHAIQAGRLSVTQVADAARRERLDELPLAEALEPLEEAVNAWLDEGHGSRRPLREKTISTYRQMWTQAVASGVFGRRPTVADVTADKVETYRRRLLKQGHPPMANRFWAAAKSFLGAKLGKRHPQVTAVQDLAKYAELKRPRRPLTVDAFWRWYDDSPEIVRSGMLALALTGMMPSELERLSPEDFVHENWWILVPGEKTEGRARIVAVPEWAWDEIVSIVPWPVDRSRVQKIITKSAKAAGVPWARLYDLRRAFARWHEELRTPSSRIQAYMGHNPATMTDSYLRSNIEPCATGDANRLGEHVAASRAPTHLKMVV